MGALKFILAVLTVAACVIGGLAKSVDKQLSTCAGVLAAVFAAANGVVWLIDNWRRKQGRRSD